MGRSKLHPSLSEHQQLANYAKALGHPARIAILHKLMDGSCVCGDLVAVLPLAQSTVSQHLKALKESGLIQGEIEGPNTCYCIDPEAWAAAKQSFEDFWEAFNPQQCC